MNKTATRDLLWETVLDAAIADGHDMSKLRPWDKSKMQYRGRCIYCLWKVDLFYDAQQKLWFVMLDRSPCNWVR